MTSPSLFNFARISSTPSAVAWSKPRSLRPARTGRLPCSAPLLDLSSMRKQHPATDAISHLSRPADAPMAAKSESKPIVQARNRPHAGAEGHEAYVASPDSCRAPPLEAAAAPSAPQTSSRAAAAAKQCTARAMVAEEVRNRNVRFLGTPRGTTGGTKSPGVRPGMGA